MIPRQKIHSLLALALMLCMVAASPIPSWASCKNSGGSSGSHRVGSQVAEGSVTICASAVSVTPARKTTVQPRAVTKPKVVPAVSKLVPVLHRKPVAQPVKNKAPIKTVPIKSAPTKPAPKKPVPKPKAPVKKVLKSVPGSSNTSAAKAMFTPAGVTASVYPSSELLVGQSASFSSEASVHYRAGAILNLPTEVRFTPETITWILDGDVIGTGSRANYSFNDVGAHLVRVEVVYSVAYRVRGSLAWINEPDSIEVLDDLYLSVSDQAESFESQPAPTTQNPRALLVGSNCLVRPAAFGCR